MEESKVLAEAHWNYIRTLLETHDTTAGIIDIVEFHYKSAFEHGYKHAMELYAPYKR